MMRESRALFSSKYRRPFEHFLPHWRDNSPSQAKVSQGQSKNQGSKSSNNRNIEENSCHKMEYPPAFRLQDKHAVNSPDYPNI